MQDTVLDLETGLGQGITPGLDLGFIMPLIIASIAVTTLLTILFLAYVIFNAMQRHKVEKATLDMQKDIHRIRKLLEQGSAPTPTLGKDLLAQQTSETEESPLA